MNRELRLMGRLTRLAARPLSCPHPCVEETEDGHTCRICGRLVDSPTL